MCIAAFTGTQDRMRFRGAAPRPSHLVLQALGNALLSLEVECLVSAVPCIWDAPP